MSRATLHYIYDPLCGWCYAAAPLVNAARGIDGLQIALYGGGLMSRRTITAELRQFVIPHDRRIAQLTGQSFGSNYIDGLLNNTEAVLDSRPPIAAVLATTDCGGDGVAC